ncbi:unnamed protein product [Pleuronectes platessa]|uniref:Uncharacterized protein n=1 Tax=Pleuronectes platessa TaxID=8262 RepID=A0A9N7TYT5_PLEPL|nr:unnamed protein product [Pleuronectes platessa]
MASSRKDIYKKAQSKTGRAGRGLGVSPPQAWHSVSQEEAGDRENKWHGGVCSVCRRLMETQQHTDTRLLLTNGQTCHVYRETVGTILPEVCGEQLTARVSSQLHSRKQIDTQ